MDVIASKDGIGFGRTAGRGAVGERQGLQFPAAAGVEQGAQLLLEELVACQLDELRLRPLTLSYVRMSVDLGAAGLPNPSEFDRRVEPFQHVEDVEAGGAHEGGQMEASTSVARSTDLPGLRQITAAHLLLHCSPAN